MARRPGHYFRSAVAQGGVHAFSIYLALPVVLVAQATNTPLSLGDLLLVPAVLLATFNAVPTVPAIGLVLVLSVDRTST